ncbi:concanavalin A-like lectin/glucanase domain-containing protein [Thamnidium elegans]|nr:concanavalin A-like lectin/glucanase domain-containing protein [Thamnidium elegans]
MLIKVALTTALFSSVANAWSLHSISAGSNFINFFNFYTGADPTHGFVQYVDQSTAAANNLVYMQGEQTIIKTDNTTVTPGGRPSVRLESKSTYNYGLFILDLEHMPVGCGTWPAFWMFGDNWPNQGEIDIIEGVNEQTTNSVALHTSSGCTMEGVPRPQLGNVKTPNCDVNAPGQGANEGCAVSSGDTRTYGRGFNENKGGVYATRWTEGQGIQVWFFTRSSIPGDITSNNPNPDTWGLPVAAFPFQSCPANKFKDLKIVLNLTFCGDWAGGVYGNSGCPSTCVDFVKNTPSAFGEAHWKINSLKVFQ